MGDTETHRGLITPNSEVMPFVTTAIGFRVLNGLSRKAIEWLCENEPGFKEDLDLVHEQAANANFGNYVNKTPQKKIKPGYVYVLAAPSVKQIKIGLTTAANPTSRISSIQTSSPVKIHKIISFYVDDCEAAEADIHNALAEYRKGGEWFSQPPLKTLNSAIEKYHAKIRTLSC